MSVLCLDPNSDSQTNTPGAPLVLSRLLDLPVLPGWGRSLVAHASLVRAARCSHNRTGGSMGCLLLGSGPGRSRVLGLRFLLLAVVGLAFDWPHRGGGSVFSRRVFVLLDLAVGFTSDVIGMRYFGGLVCLHM